jgi:hypothetical protein
MVPAEDWLVSAKAGKCIKNNDIEDAMGTSEVALNVQRFSEPRRLGMKALGMRTGFVLLMLAVFAPAAIADTAPANDPRIIINDPTCPSGATVITTQTFTFMSDANGGGFLSFCNNSGTPWLNLSINVIQPPNTTFPNDFFCESDIWATCIFTLNGNVLNIFFTDGALPDDGTGFTIDLNSDFPSTGWGPNSEFTATANVPEPGTLSLFLAGVGALVARRRIRRAV